MPDGLVSATEANRHFSRLLRAVENGEQVTITKDGKPVAVLAPAGGNGASEAGLRRMRALMKRGIPLGFRGGVNRDEAHER